MRLIVRLVKVCTSCLRNLMQILAFVCSQFYCHEFFTAVEIQCAFATFCDLSPVKNPWVIITWIVIICFICLYGSFSWWLILFADICKYNGGFQINSFKNYIHMLGNWLTALTFHTKLTKNILIFMNLLFILLT